jgi:hypothetical protein
MATEMWMEVIWLIDVFHGIRKGFIGEKEKKNVRKKGFNNYFGLPDVNYDWHSRFGRRPQP